MSPACRSSAQVRWAGAWALLPVFALGACRESRREPPPPPAGTSESQPVRRSGSDGGRSTERKAALSETSAAATGASAASGRPASRPRRPPPTTIPAGATCASAGCHDAFRTERFVHAPAAAEGCGVCHAPEQQGHKFPLLRPYNEVCTFCHVVFTGKSHKHQSVVSGHCTVCHDPHAAPHKFFFREPLAQRCATCHPPQHRKFDHGPFALGACSACHLPHEADNEALTVAAGAENCYRCHAEMRNRIEAATSVHGPVRNGCGNCHEHHTSDHPHMLRVEAQDQCAACHQDVVRAAASAADQHGALFVEKGCRNCHDAHAGEYPALLRDSLGNICLKCHDQEQKGNDGRTIRAVGTEIRKSKFLHGPVRQGECNACHQAHGSSHQRLLTQKFSGEFYQKFDLDNYALCVSCHDQAAVLDQKTTRLTGFRNGERNLHYVHVVGPEKGRSCGSCHAIHGSNQPLHMADAVPFEGGQWLLPINFKKSDTGGSCAPGCHQAYQYDRDTPVEYPSTREATP